jgi:CRISPR-associated protein Csd1
MLLTRLAEHARHRTDLPPPFYRVRSVRWMIHLHEDGSPALGELTAPGGSGRFGETVMPVPYIQRAGPHPPAMLLVDDLRYVLGHPADDSDKARADAARRHEDYTGLLTRWRDSAPDDRAAQAIVSFFTQGLHRELGIPSEAKATDVAGIMVGDDRWPHRDEPTITFWGTVARERKSSAASGICLVCGQPGPLLDTIPQMIKSGLIPAGAGRGRDAQLVSVNKPAQGRGGKIQLASAPVCDQCGSSAMSTLNVLLADKQSRYRTEDSVLAWWLREPQQFPWMDWLNNPKPGEVARLIAALDKPVRASGPGSVSANAFYAVTLSANQARAVVRDWLDVPVEQIEQNLGRWYADHRITGYGQASPQTSVLWLMAVSTGRAVTENGQDRYDRRFMPHGCERDLLLTALRGTRPLGYLLAHVLRRIRADGRIDHPRAALLRLIIVRSRPPEDRDDPKETNYMAGLDPDLPKPSYQCGRMFAVLEQIQRAALGGDVNTTIADKYLAAATATPLPILTMLRRNADGHLKRLRRTNKGAHQALSSRLDDVFNRLDGKDGFPRTLDLTGQAEFILGYHHQRAADIATAIARAEQKKATTIPDGDNQ